MITVKLFGLLRLESGIRERQLEASSIKEVFSALSDAGISKQDLEGCAILINGKSGNKRSKLCSGDTVVLMPPVAGG